MDNVDNLTAKLVMLSHAPSPQLPGGGVSPSQANLSVEQAGPGSSWSATGASSASGTVASERIPEG
eukprot:1589029-Pyramimonas_sp.AAC.1